MRPRIIKKKQEACRNHSPWLFDMNYGGNPNFPTRPFSPSFLTEPSLYFCSVSPLQNLLLFPFEEWHKWRLQRPYIYRVSRRIKTCHVSWRDRIHYCHPCAFNHITPRVPTWRLRKDLEVKQRLGGDLEKTWNPWKLSKDLEKTWRRFGEDLDFQRSKVEFKGYLKSGPIE